jgi:hypothetical protein
LEDPNWRNTNGNRLRVLVLDTRFNYRAPYLIQDEYRKDLRASQVMASN